MRPICSRSAPGRPRVLQQYARCPYRFALRGIHGLRPAGQPAGIQRMDPATRGEIYHAVQFELLRESCRRRPAGAANALDARAPAGGASATRPISRRPFRRSGARRSRPFAPTCAAGCSRRRRWKPDWTPQFSELSFGLRDPAGRDPRSRKEPVEIEGGFRLQGSIDLVERHVRAACCAWWITRPAASPIRGRRWWAVGEVLQPALYALAAEKMLGEPVAFGRLYYSTIAQNYAAIDVPLSTIGRASAPQQVLRMIDDAIATASCRPLRARTAARRCEYLPVCGPYEEERVGEKSQPS